MMIHANTPQIWAAVALLLVIAGGCAGTKSGETGGSQKAGTGARGTLLADEEYEPRMIAFAGQRWEVKGGRGLGPGPNDFAAAPDCVWVDRQGYLHLAIVPRENRWRCAEVVANQSLGYGEYRWVVAGSLAHLDPVTVLGLFLYEDDQHEIDFELSRWGMPESPNAQFVVQPWSHRSLHRFSTGAAEVLTCSLNWEPGRVTGRCWAGEETSGPPLAQWQYAGLKVPKAGHERARANLWLLRAEAPSGVQEVVIRSFSFRPSSDSK